MQTKTMNENGKKLFALAMEKKLSALATEKNCPHLKEKLKRCDVMNNNKNPNKKRGSIGLMIPCNTVHSIGH